MSGTEAKLEKEKSLYIVSGEPYTERGSKFFGFAMKCDSVVEFSVFMDKIKKEHKRASHYCYAYNIIEEKFGDQVTMFRDKVRVQKSSNDREPSGCGASLLRLVVERENCAVIVVRYFGGVLLGVGNLIRAYTQAGKNAVNCLNLKE